MAGKLDKQLVAPWEVEPIEVFLRTWDHVLSCAIMFSVRTGRRGFKATKPLFKSGTQQLRRMEGEPLLFERMVSIVAGWCGARPHENHEELLKVWARDPGTWGVVAAHEFAESYLRSLDARPQIELPL